MSEYRYILSVSASIVLLVILIHIIITSIYQIMWVSVIVLTSVGITIPQNNTTLITLGSEIRPNNTTLITLGWEIRRGERSVRSFFLIGKTKERTRNLPPLSPSGLFVNVKITGFLTNWQWQANNTTLITLVREIVVVGWLVIWSIWQGFWPSDQDQAASTSCYTSSLIPEWVDNG